MPELSRFFGIIIRMFAEAGESHHLPHFHAYYQIMQAFTRSATSSASPEAFHAGKTDLCWHGLSCTRRNCRRRGKCFRPAAHRDVSSR